jgi:hypothetical protein
VIYYLNESFVKIEEIKKKIIWEKNKKNKIPKRGDPHFSNVFCSTSKY